MRLIRSMRSMRSIISRLRDRWMIATSRPIPRDHAKNVAMLRARRDWLGSQRVVVRRAPVLQGAQIGLLRVFSGCDGRPPHRWCWPFLQPQVWHLNACHVLSWWRAFFCGSMSGKAPCCIIHPQISQVVKKRLYRLTLRKFVSLRQIGRSDRFGIGDEDDAPSLV